MDRHGRQRFDSGLPAEIDAQIKKRMRKVPSVATTMISPVSFPGGDPGTPSPNGFDNPMTTIGDLITTLVNGTPSDASRLGIGAEGDVLVVDSGIPAWIAGSLLHKVAETAVLASTPISIITCGAIADDAEDHLVFGAFRNVGGSRMQMLKLTPTANSVSVSEWYKDGGNLKAVVRNQTNTNAEVTLWYV